MENMKRVLCTGAGGPAGINFVMSLRAAPEKMFIVGTEANEHYVHLATTEKKYSVPRAIDPTYIDSLNEIIRKEKIEFLHAQPDVEVEVVSENREKIHANTFFAFKGSGESVPGQVGIGEDLAQKEHTRGENR